jgi:cell division protease FtsH
LEDRSKFKEMGGEYINGLLLYGAPGTGKTMLAKCMAGESDIAFISIEGSGFRAMFWGVDVLKMINFISRARRLAREYGACIAFIDEIDAVGASRGGVMGGGGATMGAGGAGGMMGGGTGALTRLLYEMDGVGELTRSERTRGRLYKLFGRKAPEREWHVLFMGSTNRPDVLDPALTRPGRFDRMIEVAPPDRTGRTAIIEYYLSRIKHDDTIDIEAIVADTSGYTPAQIMSAITKDAVRIALFDNRNKVNQRDIDSAFQEQAMGLENPIEDMREDQRQQVAYHEAGHAVAVYYLMPEQRIVRATIIRRSHALGYVHSAENYELHSRRLSWYVRRILVSLSGDVATKIWDEEAWTGAAGGDFINVRNSIYALAANGYFGPPVTDPKAGVYSWNLTEHESKFTRFWNQAEEKTTKMLRDHWEEVEAIALALLEKGDLTGKEVVEIIQDITGVYSRPGEEERIDELIEESSVSEPSPNGGKKQKKAAKPKAKKKKEVGSPAGD